MDCFYEVKTDKGVEFILHLEFQVTDDHSMAYRFAEYHGMALRRKKKPIRHIVIYLGSKPATMPIGIKDSEVYKGFDLISLKTLNPDVFLKSTIPEIIILAILSNYPQKQIEEIIRLVTTKK